MQCKSPQILQMMNMLGLNHTEEDICGMTDSAMKL
jgi:hypothetical protein